MKDAIITIITIYAIAAFITMEFNPEKWHIELRFLISCATCCTFFIKWYLNESNK